MVYLPWLFSRTPQSDTVLLSCSAELIFIRQSLRPSHILVFSLRIGGHIGSLSPGNISVSSPRLSFPTHILEFLHKPSHKVVIPDKCPAFNGGPRICVGQQFALTEMGYTIVRILQNFERIESHMAQVDGGQPCLKAEIVLQPGQGVRVAFLEGDKREKV
jgi:hypothetical protein